MTATCDPTIEAIGDLVSPAAASPPAALATEQPPAAWLDERWTPEDGIRMAWPWPLNSGLLLHGFSVRLANVLEHAAASPNFLTPAMQPTRISCWRDVAEAGLAQILRTRGMGRRLAGQLLGHLREAGVEPRWGQELDAAGSPDVPESPRSAVLSRLGAVASALQEALGAADLTLQSLPSCTCDDIGESPCPLHARENDLQNRALHAEHRVRKLEQEVARLRQELTAAATPRRTPLPVERPSITHKFEVAGLKGYVTVGLYPEGRPGELFVVMGKEGATLRGFCDAWARAISLLLQYGAPLEDLVHKFSGFSFEPAGWTTNPSIGHARSIIDYLARWLALRFGVAQPAEQPATDLPEAERPENLLRNHPVVGMLLGTNDKPAAPGGEG